MYGLNTLLDQIRSYDYDRIIITDYGIIMNIMCSRNHSSSKIITIRINRFDTLGCIDQSEHSLDKFNFDFSLITREQFQISKGGRGICENNINSNDYSSNNIQTGHLI